MKRIVSMMVIFTLLLGGMTHVQAQTSKAAEKADVFCTLYFYVPAADRRTDRAVCGY